MKNEENVLALLIEARDALWRKLFSDATQHWGTFILPNGQDPVDFYVTTHGKDEKDLIDRLDQTINEFGNDEDE